MNIDKLEELNNKALKALKLYQQSVEKMLHSTDRRVSWPRDVLHTLDFRLSNTLDYLEHVNDAFERLKELDKRRTPRPDESQS